MKNLFVLFFVLILQFPLAAQSSIPDFFSHLKQFDTEVSLTLEGSLIKGLLGEVEDEEGRKVLEGIERVRIIVMSEAPSRIADDTKSLVKKLKGQKFEPWIKVREEGSDVELLVRGTEEQISEALLVVQSEEESVFISLEGKFSYEDLKKLNLPGGGKQIWKGA